MVRLSNATRALLLATVLLAALGAMILGVPPKLIEGKTAMPTSFDLQGHRGARGLFPENTLPGFESALALGVTTLEMDLGMSRDGVIVVHHDRRLNPDRTRSPDGAWLDGEGPALIEHDFAVLTAYDLGRTRPDSETARRFPEQQGLDGVPMPTLEAVIARAEALSGGAVRYNLETKLSPLAPDEAPAPAVFARAVAAAIRKAGIAERAAVQSFDWRSLAEIHALAPEIATACLTAERDWLDNLERGRPGASPWTAGLDIGEFDSSVPRLVKAAGCVVWSPYFRDLREADLGAAHGLGLRVVVWTVNDPGDMASLIDLGVDGIITDYPDRLRRVMAGKGLDLPALHRER